MQMRLFNISFSISGTIDQEIHIYAGTPISNCSDQEILELFKKGELATTIGGPSPGEPPEVYLIRNGVSELVGEILHQSTQSNVAHSNFS